MITWIVNKDQVDKNFTLKELQDFSRKFSAKVLVKNFCMFQNGGITWMEN